MDRQFAPTLKNDETQRLQPDEGWDDQQKEIEQDLSKESLAGYKSRLIGRRIDSYDILEILGVGGMGVVYKALQQPSERLVAIKTLRIGSLLKPVLVQRFKREIQTIAKLNHPNIVTVYDCIIDEEGQPYVVLDYLKGKSIDELLVREKFIPQKRAIKIFAQVCSALEHAHRQGIIHRDLKPGNIMLLDDETDYVKVVDFGLAKLGDSERLTHSGELWGSPPFMAPEQCRGTEVDNRSDIYSLAAVMYEAITGTPIFESSSVFELIQKQVFEEPRPFAEAITNPDIQVSPRLEQVIFRALEKDPDRRFQTIEEFREELLICLDYPDESAPVRVPSRGSGQKVQKVSQQQNTAKGPSAGGVPTQEMRNVNNKFRSYSSNRSIFQNPIALSSIGFVLIMLGAAGALWWTNSLKPTKSGFDQPEARATKSQTDVSKPPADSNSPPNNQKATSTQSSATTGKARKNTTTQRSPIAKSHAASQTSTKRHPSKTAAQPSTAQSTSSTTKWSTSSQKNPSGWSDMLKEQKERRAKRQYDEWRQLRHMRRDAESPKSDLPSE